MKARVPIANTPGKTAQIETDATIGAVFGRDLFWPDGTLVTPQQIADMVGELARPSDDPNAGSTLWRALAEVPENVDAIASLAAEGLVRRAANGGWTAAPLSTNDLPDLPNTGGGTLQRIDRDDKGRVAGTSDATTDDLPEGDERLYFTPERAAAAAPVQSVVGETGNVSASQIKAAVSYTASDVGADPAGSAAAAQSAAQAYADGRVVDSIADADTTRAPSRNAVFDALALKANDAAVVHNSGNETVAGNKTFTGATRVQNGATTGALVVGADVNATTVSVNTRKIFRMTCPTYDGTSLPVLLFAGDMDSVGQNNVFFGGVPGASGSTQATFVNFCTASAVNTTGGNVRWLIRPEGHFRPGVDNVYEIGSAGNRAKEIFCANGTINTSDAREKSEVRAFTPAEIAAAAQIVGELGIFQWLDSIATKGENARLHAGATVQRVIEIMHAHGLDPFRYGFVCFDEWDEQPEIWSEWDAQEEVRDEETDEVIQPAVEAGRELMQEYRPAGNRYGFRHDQLTLFLLRGLAARQDALEARLAALEA
jgi:hypothetical protein